MLTFKGVSPIGALQAGTDIFLYRFLFHVLMLNMYGISLVSAEGSAAAGSVRGSIGSPFCFPWLSHASGRDRGFLPGLRVWSGVVRESQGKSLQVYHQGPCFQLPAGSLNAQYEGLPKTEREGNRRRGPCAGQMMRGAQVRAGRQAGFSGTHGPLDTKCGND